eukprot:CAMPEP_0171083716 /NCGR_PEP_ID=MMETSP0766_2-20121228/17883_1 /TAXON_ID=439317 /ORGANISM="Gambierdiscus australes, Strain CAWD 149" /LENGTH=66 /DNA_ID=CAMNT_0011541163 /DNA_START=90 /DNA_END=290 /DNA_ORIENTATION=+
MVFSLFRDAIALCNYMGTKPYFGMSLPFMFAFVQVTGVYFNNVRRHTANHAYNKFQNDEGIESDGH